MQRSQSTKGRMTMKSTRRVLGHLLLRSLVCSHRSLNCLLCTARFAHALRCAHSFAHSLTHSRAHKKEIFFYESNASISYKFIPLCNGTETTGSCCTSVTQSHQVSKLDFSARSEKTRRSTGRPALKGYKKKRKILR